MTTPRPRILLGLFLILCQGTFLRGQSPGTIANFSTLVTIPPGGSQTVGFVLPGIAPVPPTGIIGGWGFTSPSPTTALLLRAVGPTLRSFGISNPVSAPRMTLATSTGISLFFPYVVGPPSDQVDFSSIFTSAGAFPLTGGEQGGVAYNFGGFPPSAYVVTLTDDTGQGGTLLFEVYVLTGAAASAAPHVLPPQ